MCSTRMTSSSCSGSLFAFSRGRLAALLTAVVFTCSTPVMAAGGSGSEGDDETGDAMTWISLGLVVVVGGLLFLDVLAGPDAESPESDGAGVQSLDTGIDWDSVFPSDTSTVMVGISTIRTVDGTDISPELIDLLRRAAPGGILIYPDPVDLGEGSAPVLAGLADSYLDVDLLILGGVTMGDSLLLQAATSDSVVVSATFPPGTMPVDLLEIVFAAAGSLSGKPGQP
jgi:hypothetical protein